MATKIFFETFLTVCLTYAIFISSTMLLFSRQGIFTESSSSLSGFTSCLFFSFERSSENVFGFSSFGAGCFGTTFFFFDIVLVILFAVAVWLLFFAATSIVSFAVFSLSSSSVTLSSSESLSLFMKGYFSFTPATYSFPLIVALRKTLILSLPLRVSLISLFFTTI